jgi:SesB domain on fungal death-pathway protein
MRSETTFPGSGNEGLQMGQNSGTVNTTFANIDKGIRNNNNANGMQFNAENQYFGKQDYDSIH